MTARKKSCGFHLGRKVSAPAVIQLNLLDLGQLFNSMDPSPFLDKDLDDDAETFIEGWALEFPVSTPITLVIHVDQVSTVVPGGMDPRQFVETAVHNFFMGKTRAAQREMKQLMWTGQISLLIGSAFLVLCLSLSRLLGMEFPGVESIEWLKEGLAIGCWVAMWKPLDIYLYGWWPLLRRLRIYRKMSRLRVELKAKSLPNPATTHEPPAPLSPVPETAGP